MLTSKINFWWGGGGFENLSLEFKAAFHAKTKISRYPCSKSKSCLKYVLTVKMFNIS